MALVKRGRTWHTQFYVNGARYRQSLRTTDWREALQREKELIAQASVGKLAPSSQQFARLAFSVAVDRYLEDRKAYLAPRSIRTEQERLKNLRLFFGATPLTRITVDSIREYVAGRKSAGLSNRTVNMETGCLARVLKRAKRWHLIAEELKPLPKERSVGRALAHEEKVKLLKAAARKPEWMLARLAATLALNTTMRSCEIRGLRWRDVDFIERTLTVRRSKTEAGERVIPLNGDGWAAILELRERAKLLLGVAPQLDWYLFPHGEGQGPVTHTTIRPGPESVTVKPDPTKPMISWRTAWRKIAKEAGLSGLRFHDLRHHAITELAEGQASDQTIRSIAGHVSLRMLEHYSHVRLDAKRKALDALSGGAFEAVTTQPTTQISNVSPQVIDKNGGADGVRTRDLLRDRQAF